jgi:hypothetical protein
MGVWAFEQGQANSGSPWAARDDGQDKQVVPVIDDAGHLRRQTQRRALDQAGSEADRPGIYLSCCSA